MTFIKTYTLIILAVLCTSSLFSNTTVKKKKSPAGTSMYSWEAQRNGLVNIDDLVLTYAGGAHRPYTWNKKLLNSYVAYTDESNKEHWLFDGFLLLEIFDTVNKKIYATGYHGEPTFKEDWKALVDFYFLKGNAVYALEESVAETAKRIGEPITKRKVVIGMPEPISKMNNWGKVNGKDLDFTSSDADRITACKWYIDYVRECFDKGKFKHVELAGFYWVAEEQTHTRSILKSISEYLNDLNYSFNWIPYWNSDGYKDWKEVNFNNAYLQPNYYFNDKIEYSRLDQACAAAIQYDMDMEVEFDESALAEGQNRGYRLRDYMNAFRLHKIIETKKLAYYQGGVIVDKLKKSKNKDDQRLYHDFCQFVLDHQKYMNGTQKPSKLVLDNYKVPLNQEGAKVGTVLAKEGEIISIAQDASGLFTLRGNTIYLKSGKKLTSKSPMVYEISVKCGDKIKAFDLVKDEFLNNKVIAHRGAWKHNNVHQNSNGALKKAIELGCQGSEFDVWLTKDLQIGLNHDPEINGLYLEETVLAEMQKIILEKGEVMATLEEYINIIKTQNKTRLVLELKSNKKNDRIYALTDSVIDLVHRMKAQAWVDYITFDYRGLLRVRELDATAHTAYLGANRPLDLQRVEGMSGIDYHFSQFSKIEKLYERARILGLTINIWTVNDEKWMNDLLDMDVDFITTDEPEKLLEIISKRNKN